MTSAPHAGQVAFMTCVVEETRAFAVLAAAFAFIPAAGIVLLLSTFAPHEGHMAIPSSILVPQILHFDIIIYLLIKIGVRFYCAERTSRKPK